MMPRIRENILQPISRAMDDGMRNITSNINNNNRDIGTIDEQRGIDAVDLDDLRDIVEQTSRNVNQVKELQEDIEEDIEEDVEDEDETVYRKPNRF
jgi:hypothetical protein